MISEAELTERCKRGDNAARKLLYETYASYLLGVCLRYVGNRNTAEDLLHDGFIKIFSHFDQFEYLHEGSLKSWMFKVQQNVVLQHLRKNIEWQDVVSLDKNEELTNITEPETVKDIPKRELVRLIAELPDGYRTVFNMFVIDGLSHKEIAKTLGIQEKSSASQLFRARKMLAERIIKWRNENL